MCNGIVTITVTVEKCEAPTQFNPRHYRHRESNAKLIRRTFVNPAGDALANEHVRVRLSALGTAWCAGRSASTSWIC